MGSLAVMWLTMVSIVFKGPTLPPVTNHRTSKREAAKCGSFVDRNPRRQQNGQRCVHDAFPNAHQHPQRDETDDTICRRKSNDFMDHLCSLTKIPPHFMLIQHRLQNSTKIGVSSVQIAVNNSPTVNTYLPPYRCANIPHGNCVIMYPQ